MRKVIAALFVVLLMTLAACETESATNVTETSATLNGRGNCESGWHFYWWYEMRQIEPNPTGWYQATSANRVDCSGHNDPGPLPTSVGGVGGLTPGAWYQFRIGAQADGQPQYVYDRNGDNAQKGTSAENNLSYDEVKTFDSGTDGIGNDYDANSAEPAVSGEYACKWHMDVHPAVLIGDATDAGTTVYNCRSVPLVYTTCQTDLSIGQDHFYDTDHGDQGCLSAAAAMYLTLGKRVGMRGDFYMRLLNTKRRWTSSFYSRPKNGNCETYFNTINNKRYHVLHCYGFYGRYTAGPS